MMVVHPDLKDRAERYLTFRIEGAKIKKSLGDGTDGAVWATTYDTAVKVFEHPHLYQNEWRAYKRLADYDVIDEIEGFSIPEMLGFDDGLLVIEMDVMEKPPYIIDFAKVRIDFPPDFPPETVADSEARGLERFGGNWPKVKNLLAALESYGIYYLDPSPYNIVFPDQ